MSKEDFVQHFDYLDLCHLTPDSMDSEVFNTGFKPVKKRKKLMIKGATSVKIYLISSNFNFAQFGRFGKSGDYKLWSSNRNSSTRQT
jgi:hypothetical protein